MRSLALADDVAGDRRRRSALMLALGFAAIVKSRLLAQILGYPVSGWRWPLVWAAVGGSDRRRAVRSCCPNGPSWSFGIPAILAAFGAVLWIKGFGPEDRELFRMRKEDIEELSLPDPGSTRRVSARADARPLERPSAGSGASR